MTHLVVIHCHRAVPLIVLRTSTIWAVDGDLMVVSSQAVAVGVIVCKETTLKHLVWRWLNTWNKVGRGEGQLFHL